MNHQAATWNDSEPVTFRILIEGVFACSREDGLDTGAIRGRFTYTDDAWCFNNAQVEQRALELSLRPTLLGMNCVRLDGGVSIESKPKILQITAISVVNNYGEIVAQGICTPAGDIEWRTEAFARLSATRQHQVFESRLTGAAHANTVN